jgi:TetR/AcrR family transcriptional regulator of autoinduction and epiphytic fitness
MSKKTLYQHFATKEALFAATIAERTDKLVAEIKSDGGERSPQEALEAFMGRVAHFCLAPRQVAMHRLVVTEATRSPELARAFLGAGQGRAKRRLVKWLPLQRSLGVVTAKDAERAGGMLMGMIVGEPCMKLLFGIGRPPSKREIDRRVKRAVDVFLHGYRGAAWAR